MTKKVAVTFIRGTHPILPDLERWLNYKFSKGYRYVNHINESGYRGVTFIFEKDEKDGKGN